VANLILPTTITAPSSVLYLMVILADERRVDQTLRMLLFVVSVEIEDFVRGGLDCYFDGAAGQQIAHWVGN